MLLSREAGEHSVRLMMYYGSDSLLTVEQASQTNEPFQVFVTQLEDGQQGYFLQKTAGLASAMPAGEYSDSDWHFVGSDRTLTEQLNRWQDRNQFEQDMLDWYRQDALGIYGDNGQIGDIYSYDFHELVNVILPIENGKLQLYSHGRTKALRIGVSIN